MGLFDKFSKKGGSSETVKTENREQTRQYYDYITSNFAKVSKILTDLQNETQGLVGQITSSKGIKMSFREKGELRKIKEKANKNLQYLYLSRDFLVALSKNASNIALQNEELMLVTKFAPYFDGVPVLDVEDSDSDDSVLGAFKEVGHELMSAFVSSKKSSRHFDFEDYLCRYEEQLDEFIMPDINGAIASFTNVAPRQDATSATQPAKSNVVICPCCGANLTGASSLTECEYCGSQLR